MNNVLAIIGEYNPFHNGHLYHLNTSKKMCSADYTILIMTGNFTQRGDTSIIDKWTKTQTALLNGIDLVIELPTIYSISSAENFASGAIKILDELRIVDNISFGSEVDDIEILDRCAEVLYEEPDEFISVLEHELSKGISFPKARENALLIYLNDIRKYANVLSSPNNILGIEYLKALKKYSSPIQPITVKRNSVEYNSVRAENNFASSTAIRKMIENNNLHELRECMPENSYELVANSIKLGHFILSLKVFEKQIIYNFRKMSKEEIANLPDVSEGLDNLIKYAAESCNTLEEFINIVKSKRYAQTRIQRICLYTLLGYTKQDMEISKKINPYVRILGFNSKGKKILSEIANSNNKIQIVTSVKKFETTCKNKKLLSLLKKDIYATDVYTLGFDKNSYSGLDYTNKIVSM